MTPPNSRHRVHAELDELISAQDEHRPALPEHVPNPQRYADLDDEYDANPVRTRSQIRATRMFEP